MAPPGSRARSPVPCSSSPAPGPARPVRSRTVLATSWCAVQTRRRVLLLTFTRRAAETMTRRAEQIASQVASTSAQPARIGWSGTFHAIANRLLRQHADSVGLDPSFTVLDRSDSADLLNVVRNELGFSNKATRFPRKDTCLAIYSHAVNAGHAVEKTLERAFPWCANWVEELKRLFGAYVEAKQQRHLLDYDDLLLYWFHLMQEGPGGECAAPVRSRAGGRIPGHECAPGGNPTRPETRRPRSHGSGRRCAVHLLLPGRDGAKHPRLPAPV